MFLLLFHKKSDLSDSTSNDIAERPQGLTLDSQDMTETASTASPVGKAEEAEEHKANLNNFLLSCKVKPLQATTVGKNGQVQANQQEDTTSNIQLMLLQFY